MLALATLLALSLVVFFATNITPIDPARSNLGRGATPEQLALYRKEHHLDDPIITRYAAWLEDVSHWNWGTSLSARRPVTDVISTRVRPTLYLTLASVLLAIPVAFAIGVITGVRHGRAVDGVLSTAMLLVGALPSVVVALFLIVLFGVRLQWLPVDSTAITYSSGSDAVKAYVLPALALAIAIIPYISRMVRSTVAETMSAPYVEAARLRGISERRLTLRHVLPVALVPVMSVVMLSIADLLLGVVVIEYVFGFPGLGGLLADGISSQDVPLVQAIVLLVGAAYVLLNTLADSAAGILDPRTTLER